ncbi:hypothetical protein O1611_g8473 [Lasiodiplodia mahajangana]|uniref:Uncharacterized protein n=1 Tax=Lasiodiplodia mahajangana TaxID=1108764 RepID=A0ACC2JCE4_9PEZI|nr:hypothetical protein O1611_g8473 [Lasiodiplodia mahajangana]
MEEKRGPGLERPIVSKSAYTPCSDLAIMQCRRGLSFDVMIGSSGVDTTLSSAAGRSETPLSSQEHGSVASGLSREPTSRPVSHPTATPKPTQTQTLWILIFKGQPKDLVSTRTTEFYLALDEDQGTNVTIRMQGEYPNSRVHEERNQPQPWLRPNFYRRLAVSAFAATGKELDMRVRNTIWETPVNRELEYGCQSWVGNALEALQNANLITVEEGDSALTGMIEFVSQATDGWGR